MWFDYLMDDCKESYDVSQAYHGVYFPVFLKLIMGLVMGAFLIGSIVTLVVGGALSNFEMMDGFEIAMHLLKSVGLMGLLAYLLYMVLWGLIEVGTINMIKAAFNDEKPNQAIFLDGIRSYLAKVSLGKLLIQVVVLVLSPVLFIGFILYALLIGIPTAGYGVIFLFVAIGAYFATWTIAIVVDDMDITEGIGTSIRLGRNHFKPLFLIVLATSTISSQVVMLFGPLGAVFAGWFLGGVVGIFFKMVTYKTYLRYNNEKQQYSDF